MIIFTVVISILAITGLIWLLDKILPFYICPICAGVSGTWLWLLAGMLSGQLATADYQLPVAILMGGSVVGIAYQLEKNLPARLALLWKTLFIPIGFAAVYSLMFSWLAIFFGLIVLLVSLAIIFIQLLKNPSKTSLKVKELKKQMEKCC